MFVNMNYIKVLSVVVLSVIFTFQLCGSNAIKSKIYYPNDDDAEKVNVYHDHQREPESVSDNVSVYDVFGEEEINTSTEITTTMRISSPRSDIKIADQKYSQNTSGEYKHEVLFNNGDWRAEHGEYEDHNGVTVFVIRGVFSYHTREGTYNTTLYIVDEFGYHNVQPPPQLTAEEGGLIDYRPDVSTTSDCSNEKGSYCIDPKLLALLVG